MLLLALCTIRNCEEGLTPPFRPVQFAVTIRTQDVALSDFGFYPFLTPTTQVDNLAYL
jgi:hypothetical protein